MYLQCQYVKDQRLFHQHAPGSVLWLSHSHQTEPEKNALVRVDNYTYTSPLELSKCINLFNVLIHCVNFLRMR